MSLPEKTHEIISRADAKARDLKLYFTGRPCKRGHIAPRQLSGTCVECAPAYKEKHAAKIQARDPQGYKASVNESVRRHYERNRDAILDKKRDYYLSNQETLKAKAQARRDAKKAEKAAATAAPAV
jgi:hypothetical protein